MAYPSRREFIKRATAAGIGTLLSGTACESKQELEKTIETTTDKDQYSNDALKKTVETSLGEDKEIILPTNEWYGDIVEKLRIPGNLEVDMRCMEGHSSPALTYEEIRDSILKPIASKQLSEIVKGKKSAAIVFDDITRPTPVKEVAEILVGELNEAGISDIAFLCASGAHQPMKPEEARAKLGDLVDRYSWVSHDCYGDLVGIGKTSGGTPVKINRLLTEVDAIVTISGIKLHNMAGYSGGGKIILPGCVSVEETIRHNHRYSWVGGNGNISKNRMREDMEETARMAGVDFSVQVVVNGRRQVAGVWAGDIVESFRYAAVEANKRYRTKLAEENSADVVIANPYPRNLQQSVPYWAWDSLRRGGTAIEVFQYPGGRGIFHALGERRPYDEERDGSQEYTFSSPWGAGRKIVYCEHLDKLKGRIHSGRNVKMCQSWDEVYDLIKDPSGRLGLKRAVVYPNTGTQHRDTVRIK